MATAGDEAWTPAQRAVVLASYLGWMLDAFDFFLVVFVLDRIAHEFHASITAVTLAITLTLAMRPIGALLFGRVADRFGRRPAMMASVLLYSVMELASAFAPSLAVFIALRALYGVAMGGEWGVGASLALEAVPVRSRGFVSGLLQAGYPSGYLIAAVVFGLLVGHIGWRGLFVVGALPALLVLYIRRRVPESAAWRASRAAPEARHGLLRQLKGHWKLALYAMALMTAFNFFSHGTQDLYPLLLGSQRHFSTAVRSTIAVLYNLGAIGGGLCFGALSGRIGRRNAIALAALLALPALPFWAFSTQLYVVTIAAIVMQFMVQGAWGVVPAHLNELSPSTMRATFPGVVYQVGNLLASYNATMQSGIADRHGGAAHPDYGFALAWTAGVVAVVLAVLALVGPENRRASFLAERQDEAEASSTPVVKPGTA